MGWCQEFGIQTRDGCDHLMVAGRDSCSCPACGFRCTGKFDGCSSVWRAGPTPVSLSTRLSEVVTSRPELGPGQSNGSARPSNGTREVAASALVPVASAGSQEPAGEAGTEVVPTLESLIVEVRLLAQKVDQLPATMLAAMAELRGGIRKDLVELRRRLVIDIRNFDRTAARDAILPELDARFEWLTNELSKRLVIVGNEVATIRRQLAEESPESSANGKGGRLFAASPFFGQAETR